MMQPVRWRRWNGATRKPALTLNSRGYARLAFVARCPRQSAQGQLFRHGRACRCCAPIAAMRLCRKTMIRRGNVCDHVAYHGREWQAGPVQGQWRSPARPIFQTRDRHGSPISAILACDGRPVLTRDWRHRPDRRPLLARRAENAGVDYFGADGKPILDKHGRRGPYPLPRRRPRPHHRRSLFRHSMALRFSPRISAWRA